MKQLTALLAAGLFTAGSVFAGRSIVWVSDQYVQNFGSDSTDNDGGLDCRFSAGAGPYADEAFVTLLRNAGYSVTRCNPPNSPNILHAADVATLNSFDLVVLGRSLLSGSFDAASEVAPWNEQITKPLLCTNTYLSRSNRLGWFSAPGNPVQPDQVFNTLTFSDLSDPLQAYLSVTTPLTGGVTDDTITQDFNFPNDGAFDARGISNLTGSTINPGGTILATSLINASGMLSPYIAQWPAGTVLTTTGTGAVAAGQVLGGYRLQFLAGIREAAAAPNNGVRNAGFNSLTPVGERMFLRAVALAMNNGAVPADADDDGVPDAWETTHFGSPAVTTGNEDDDGDGLKNLIEYAFSLNPLSGDQSAFGFAAMANGLMEISITKQPHCCYVVETSTELVSWTRDNVADDADGLSTVVNDASTLRVRETASSSRRKFRIRVYPMPL